METNKANDYLMKKMIRKEAMKRISSQFALNTEQLAEYRRELDWEEVSANTNISWTAAMIDRWSDQLDWKIFSRRANEAVLIPEIIERFKDRWDWSELSDNSDLKLSYDLVDKFIDRWDWEKLINRSWYHESCDLYSIDFFNRYAKYIPMENIENSNLWEAIVEEEEKSIKKEILLKPSNNQFSKH